jgi:hypothetical protein
MDYFSFTQNLEPSQLIFLCVSLAGSIIFGLCMYFFMNYIVQFIHFREQVQIHPQN